MSTSRAGFPNHAYVTAEGTAPPIRQYKRRSIALSARMRPRRSPLVAYHKSPSFTVTSRTGLQQIVRHMLQSCPPFQSYVLPSVCNCERRLMCTSSCVQHIRTYPSAACTTQSILPSCGPPSASPALVWPANRSRQRRPGAGRIHVNRQVVPVADASLFDQ